MYIIFIGVSIMKYSSTFSSKLNKYQICTFDIFIFFFHSINLVIISFFFLFMEDIFQSMAVNFSWIRFKSVIIWTIAAFPAIFSILKYIYEYINIMFYFFLYQHRTSQCKATFPCQNKNKWHNPFSFPLQNYILFLFLNCIFLFQNIHQYLKVCM